MTYTKATVQVSIRSRWGAQRVLWQGEATSLGEAVLRALRSDADLRGAVLRGADLTGAILTDAVLRGAVLTGAAIPVVPDLDLLIEVATRDEGRLEMGSWHTCATTHCRAGWAIHLAGEAGAELEKAVGSSAAGALIYAAAGSHPVPDFFASNEDARADIVARAAAHKIEGD